MDVLHPSQVDRLVRVFMCFAKQVELSDGSYTDGISAVELRAVLQALGLHPTDAELHEIISRSDTQGRGFLDSAEFVQLMSNELNDTENDVELLDAFRAADTERNGVLTPIELAGVLAAAVPPGTEAAADAGMTLADIRAIIDEAAGPGAKGISMPQFVALMRTQQ